MNNVEIIEQHSKDTAGNIVIKQYQKAQLLGKGGFAKCYRGIQLQTMKEIAIKVVEKANLCRNRAKQKLLSQIKIHRTLKHPYIVSFETVFEDDKNVYIILELCRCRTLGEMVKKRKFLTPPETRYYISQLLEALKYLHQNKVIHRDLKMGNIFLNERMQMKLGDFGLSAKLQYCDEKKRTMAGTPNYIAPEIIEGTGGHSYEVDLWSTGVICYALLFGRPPFETAQLKMTYSKIKNCQYNFPSSVNVPPQAKDFIANILVLDPKKRMTLAQMQFHPFLRGQTPKMIPTSATQETPLFSKEDLGIQCQEKIKFVSDNNNENICPQFLQKPNNPLKNQQKSKEKTLLKQNTNTKQNQKQLCEYNASNNQSRTNNENILLKLGQKTFSPHVFAHVDYSTKYGMGYYLSCNNTYGVYFNDSTILSYDRANNCYYYIISPSNKEDNVEIERYASQSYPSEIKNYSKKKLLLQKFEAHLEQEIIAKKKLLNEEQFNSVCNGNVYVKQWLKTKHAIMFRLSNKIFQVNFQDRSQILLNTEKREVYFTSKKGEKIHETLSEALNQNRKDTELGRRIKYTRQILNSLKKESKPSQKYDN